MSSIRTSYWRRFCPRLQRCVVLFLGKFQNYGGRFCSWKNFFQRGGTMSPSERLDRLSLPRRTRQRAGRQAEWQLPPPCPNQGHHRALALHQIAELTSAWGSIAAKITDQSAHPATSRVLDPLQCPVLGLGEGDETALRSKQRTD